LGEGEAGVLGPVSVGGAELFAGVGVFRWKALPAIKKCLLKFSIIVNLLVVIVFPSLSAVVSWEVLLLLSMDFTVSQNILELVLLYANFCLKKLALAFLTACIYWFLTSLKVAYRRDYLILVQNATRCFCAGQG
jgi:hypothetical protein